MKKLIKIFTLISVMATLSACSWFEDDAVKPAPLVSFKQSLAVEKMWSNGNSTGTAKQYLKLTPAIVGNRAYTVSYLGKIRAVNTANGSTVWKIKTNTYLTSGIAADDGLLFVGSGHGQVLALRQTDGSVKWRNSLHGEILTTPVVAQNKVIIKSEDGQLLALDEQSGAKLWSYKQDEPSLVLRGSSVPKIIGDLVVSGFANGELVAVNIDSGRLLWKQPLAEPTGSSVIERMIDIDADTAVIDNVIYASSYQGNIAAVSLKGQLLWKRALSSYTGVVADMSNVYVSDEDGTVWALNRKNGAIVWQQEALANRDVTAPVLYGKYLVVGDKEGYVHWLQISDGRFAARARADSSRIIVAPMVSGNGLYITTTAGRLARFG